MLKNLWLKIQTVIKKVQKKKKKAGNNWLNHVFHLRLVKGINLAIIEKGRERTQFKKNNFFRRKKKRKKFKLEWEND